jgi:hypothetical protein
MRADEYLKYKITKPCTWSGVLYPRRYFVLFFGERRKIACFRTESNGTVSHITIEDRVLDEVFCSDLYPVVSGRHSGHRVILDLFWSSSYIIRPCYFIRFE